mmetsp:Transcript_19312/g.36135  ORF Transcript_19312/g.36135 Transcript_19312/m.36135 type:complete len:258 (+) Transcript_19312:220-993(+)
MMRQRYSRHSCKRTKGQLPSPRIPLSAMRSFIRKPSAVATATKVSRQCLPRNAYLVARSAVTIGIRKIGTTARQLRISTNTAAVVEEGKTNRTSASTLALAARYRNWTRPRRFLNLIAHWAAKLVATIGTHNSGTVARRLYILTNIVAAVEGHRCNKISASLPAPGGRYQASLNAQLVVTPVVTIGTLRTTTTALPPHISVNTVIAVEVHRKSRTFASSFALGGRFQALRQRPRPQLQQRPQLQLPIRRAAKESWTR